MQLRDYQLQLKGGTYTRWSLGAKAVCAVSPTGSGKTVLMGSVALDRSGMGEPGVVIAHRVELVGQISMTLARFGIEHNIIGSSATVKFCISQHIKEVGRSYYSPNAMVTVAAVDTLRVRARRDEALFKQWAADIRWWMIDECHHVLHGNKWGTAVEMFPNARGLGVTATPLRADRKSLHVEQGGVFDQMVAGPTMRDLINRGSLCDYEIYVPPQSIVMTDEDKGSNGEFKKTNTVKKAHESQVVGDVVKHYLKLAPGLRGITFTVDVDQAIDMAAEYNDNGVPAMAVSAKTPDSVRQSAVDKFRRGALLQLVNVDLFGEGFDVPAVEVVSMARPTMSYGLYVQQFGRALRTLDGKERGIIIDHVGNVMRHGLPDAPREWSLWAERRGKDDDVIPMTSCTACFFGYERIYTECPNCHDTRCKSCNEKYDRSLDGCPHCGHVVVSAPPSRPEQVDGDLVMLDPATLAQMRGEIEHIASHVDPTGLRGLSLIKVTNHNKTAESQTALRETIALWAGMWRDRGAEDSEIYRRFFHRFGTDIGTAQTLKAADATALRARILESNT